MDGGVGSLPNSGRSPSESPKKSAVVLGTADSLLPMLSPEGDDSNKLAPRPTGLNIEGLLEGAGELSGLNAELEATGVVEVGIVGIGRTGSTISV